MLELRKITISWPDPLAGQKREAQGATRLTYMVILVIPGPPDTLTPGEISISSTAITGIFLRDLCDTSGIGNEL